MVPIPRWYAPFEMISMGEDREERMNINSRVGKRRGCKQPLSTRRGGGERHEISRRAEPDHQRPELPLDKAQSTSCHPCSGAPVCLQVSIMNARLEHAPAAILVDSFNKKKRQWILPYLTSGVFVLCRIPWTLVFPRAFLPQILSSPPHLLTAISSLPHGEACSVWGSVDARCAILILRARRLVSWVS